MSIKNPKWINVNSSLRAVLAAMAKAKHVHVYVDILDGYVRATKGSIQESLIHHHGSRERNLPILTDLDQVMVIGFYKHRPDILFVGGM